MSTCQAPRTPNCLLDPLGNGNRCKFKVHRSVRVPGYTPDREGSDPSKIWLILQTPDIRNVNRLAQVLLQDGIILDCGGIRSQLGTNELHALPPFPTAPMVELVLNDCSDAICPQVEHLTWTGWPLLGNVLLNKGEPVSGRLAAFVALFDKLDIDTAPKVFFLNQVINRCPPAPVNHCRISASQKLTPQPD